MIGLLFIRKSLYRALYLFDLILRNKPKLFVVCYHSISSDWLYGVPLNEFKKQINYLASYYNFITPLELELYLQSKLELNFPSVLLTFDDGYEDILKTQGFLEKKNIKPLLFLLSDQKHIYRQELATQKKLLTKKQILDLKKSGWELGSHGATHQNFWTLNKSQIENEVKKSKKKLSKDFGKIKYFAYPKGRFTRTILVQVSKAKYSLAFGMNDGFIDKKSNKFLIPRVGINQTHGFEEFVALFSPSVVRFRKACKSIKLERAFV